MLRGKWRKKQMKSHDLDEEPPFGIQLSVLAEGSSSGRPRSKDGDPHRSGHLPPLPSHGQGGLVATCCMLSEVVIFPGPIEVGPKQPRKAAPKDKSFLNAGASVPVRPKIRPEPSDAPGGFDDQVLQGPGKGDDDLRDGLDDEKDGGDDGNVKDNDARDGDPQDNDARDDDAKDEDPKDNDARGDDVKDDDAKDDGVKDEIRKGGWRGCRFPGRSAELMEEYGN